MLAVNTDNKVSNNSLTVTDIPLVSQRLNACMGRKPKIQTRIEYDTKESIDAYLDDQPDEMNQSECVRHLLRTALAEKGYPVPATEKSDTALERIARPRMLYGGVLMIIVGLAALSLAGLYAEAGRSLYAVASLALGVFSGVVGTTLGMLAVIAQIALNRPLRYLGGLGTTEEAAT